MITIERGPVYVVPGEVGILGNRQYIKADNDNLDPFTTVSVEASVIKSFEDKDSRFIFIGTDPFDTGNDETILMQRDAIRKNPALIDRTVALPGNLDTSVQAEAASKELKRPEYEGRSVRLIVPFEHKYRTKTHLNAFGVEEITVFESNSTYIKEKEEFNKLEMHTSQEIRSILYMHINLIKELGLDVVTFLNPKGTWNRRLSEIVRN